jgi:hypothetical protein
MRAVTGSIQIVPDGKALTALRNDYAAILDDGLLSSQHKPTFEGVMATCLTPQEPRK